MLVHFWKTWTKAGLDNAQHYTRTWHLVNELAWRLPVDPRIDLHRMTLSITYGTCIATEARISVLNIAAAHCSMRSYEMRKAAETTLTAIMRVHQSKAVALDLLAIAEKFGEEEYAGQYPPRHYTNQRAAGACILRLNIDMHGRQVYCRLLLRPGLH